MLLALIECQFLRTRWWQFWRWRSVGLQTGRILSGVRREPGDDALRHGRKQYASRNHRTWEPSHSSRRNTTVRREKIAPGARGRPGPTRPDRWVPVNGRRNR